MNIGNWLSAAQTTLDNSGVPTARLDVLVLLEDATGRDRGWLLAHLEQHLKRSDLLRLDVEIERRAGHEPLAYIRGKSEFYGREFLVTADTLQPRPETETMIDLLKNLLQHNNQLSKAEPWKITTFVDVGTGSGCLAITAKLEFPDAEAYATDINEAALKIAHKNAEKLKVDVTFYQGNLLQPLPSTIYQLPSTLFILANLPYVPNSHTINKAAMQEPSVALFGGEDGLDLYREMFEQLENRDEKIEMRKKPEYILTESLPFQHEALAGIAKKNGYLQTAEEDFIQVFDYQPL